MARAKRLQTAICVGFGWALLAAWADLFGHSTGFALPYSGLDALGNMRIYWLVGLFLLAAGMAAIPGWFERAKRHLFFCLPLVASFGTMAFAVSCQQEFFPPEAVAVIGIVVAGTGYTWFTCLFCTVLAQTQRMSYAIASIVAGLVLKTVLVQVCTNMLSESLQVGIAIVLPLVIAALACGAQRGPDTRLESDEWKPQGDGAAGYRYLVPQVIVSVIAVATTRVMTPLGFFGDPLSLFAGTAPAALGTLAICAVLIVLSHFTLAKRVRVHPNTRFMPALLVIVLAFFVSGFGASAQGAFAAAAEVFITATEALAHALFWTVAITVIRLKDASPFRVVGLSTGFYDLLSIVWVAFFFSLGVANNAVILVVAVVFVMVTIWLVDRGSGQEKAVVPPNFVADRREELAERYALSPRERDVFMMLAQGRSRAYISEDLVLSEGTIKTHISHIYTKLGVSNRQEMFDLLLEEAQGSEE